MPAELKTAWEEWSKLRTEVPAPAVYSPHLWRRYHDTLLRYEQLLRAGDPTKKAASLRTSLTRLKGRIGAARRFGLVSASATNTLSLPAALGQSPAWPHEELSRQFEDLWNAPPDKRQEVFDKLKEWAGKQGNAPDAAAGRQLQVELSTLLLEKVTQNDSDYPDLERADNLMRLVERPDVPRPAEAHALFMLLRDLDKKARPPVADARLALTVRLGAEQASLGIGSKGGRAHPYSDAVFPWIKEQIEPADNERALGTDYLFGRGDDWKTARQHLESAQQAYGKAGERATTVREALDTRDRVLATLPYYAQWLAFQQPGASREELPAGQLLGQTEELAKDLVQLVGHIEAAKPGDRDLVALKGLTAKVEKDFSDIKQAFDQTCQRLAQHNEDQRHFLHEIEDVLAIPLVEDPPTRLTLLVESRRLSTKFNSEFNPAAEAGKAAPDEDARAKMAMERARRQGRMAAAVTGLAGHWLDEDDLTQLRHLVQDLALVRWRDDVQTAGERLAGRWQQMRKAISEGLQASSETPNLRQAAHKLQGPEYLCRLIPGGLVPAAPVEPFDAVEGSRRLRVHDLLLWQAQRTLNDHWFMGLENPTITYYIPAGKNYVLDAKTLAESGSDKDLNKSRQEAARAMDDKLVPAMLKAAGLPERHVTERDFRVAWKVTADPGMPRVVPVFRLEVEGPVRALNSKDLDRKALEDPLPADLEYRLEKREDNKSKVGNTDTQTAKATLRGVFRGQRLDPETVLYLHQTPEIIAYKLPPPPVAGIAVRMDPRFTYGAISIVLDCSGSMGKGYPNATSKKRRFDHAADALEEVLKKIPAGTYLSLYAFGYKTGPGNTEGTWEDTKIKEIRPPRQWNPAEVQALIDDVRAHQPMNGSPIVDGILTAKLKGFPKSNYKGAKVLLALTDGDDNAFTEPAYPRSKYLRGLHQTDDIPRFLELEFKNSGIEVNVVCFNKDNPVEVASAKKQFEVVETLEQPGQFVPQPKGGSDLAKTLENALRPRLRLFQGNRPAPGFPEEGVSASRHNENFDWRKVRPNLYDARVRGTYAQSVELKPGDVLGLNIGRVGGDIIWDRGIFANDLVNQGKPAPPERKGTWLAAVLQNGYVRTTGKLQQLLTLEDLKSTAGREGTLRQVAPRFVWMELKAKGDMQNRRFEWHNEFGYPAPAVRLEAPDWPNPDVAKEARPELRVWWAEDVTPDPFKFLPHSPGRFTDLEGKTIHFPGNDVTIERVTLDSNRTVTVWTPSGTKTAQKPCLVVEISHTPGQPVWAQADGLEAPGEEHRFYTNSGKYTAIFWGVSEPQARTFRLNVISLADFKKAAEPNRSAAFQLRDPRPGDSGPLPISLTPLE
jgi:hypothetical protein